jgi:hypothetical protein
MAIGRMLKGGLPRSPTSQSWRLNEPSTCVAGVPSARAVSSSGRRPQRRGDKAGLVASSRPHQAHDRGCRNGQVTHKVSGSRPLA